MPGSIFFLPKSTHQSENRTDFEMYEVVVISWESMNL